MTDPDFRALCAEMLDCDDGAIFGTDLVTRARAALAQPVGEGLSAADLLSANPPNIPTSMAMQYRSAWREGVEDGWNEARAVLARWGHPASTGGTMIVPTANYPTSRDYPDTLSYAAEAVWEAFNEVADRVGIFENYGDALAAALATAALYLNHDCQQLLAIAAELEAAQPAPPPAAQPAPPVAPVTVDARDPECVERWPDCHSEGYDPRCCRFPKSCSCGGEPPAAQPPAPAGGLVERVAKVMATSVVPPGLWCNEARAAIREVAAWMRSELNLSVADLLLEQEANR